MQPWILEQVAHEHRRDLLAKADRWRLIHRQSVGSPERVDVSPSPAGSALSRIRLRRRGEQIACANAATNTVASATARYAS